MPWQRQTEQFQKGGSDVDNRRLLIADFVIAEEHSWNQPRINAVIAAPGFQVVFKDLAGYLAHDGIPRGAEAIAVTDNQIGGIVDVGAGIDGVAIENTCDSYATGGRIDKSVEFFPQFGFQGVRVSATLDNAFAFGQLFDERPTDRETGAVRAFNELMAKSLSATVSQTL